MKAAIEAVRKTYSNLINSNKLQILYFQYLWKWLLNFKFIDSCILFTKLHFILDVSNRPNINSLLFISRKKEYFSVSKAKNEKKKIIF